MNKSILFITPRFGRLQGGVGVSAFRITKALENLGSIKVITLNENGSPLSVQSKPLHKKSELLSITPHPDQKTFFQHLHRIILENLNQEDILISFYGDKLSYPASLAARYKKVNHFIFCRGNDVDLEPFSGSAFMIKEAFDHAHQIITVSHEMKMKATCLTQNKNIQVIANGVDTNLFKPSKEISSLKNKALKIGLFGDIKTKKGFSTLLEAHDPKQFEIHLVGRIRTQCEKLLHGYMTLHPEAESSFVKHDYTDDPKELIKRYEDVDLVCIPSFYDGLPNVLLEAMSLEKLCLVSNVGGLIDVVRHQENGFVFHSGDANDLKEKLFEAKRELQSERSILQKAARKTILENFTLEIEKRNILNLFN